MGRADEGVASHQLRTARLTLRRPTLADARPIFETYAGVDEVTRYMGWPRHQTITTTETFLTFALREWDQHGTGTFLIEQGGELIGSTGLHLDGPGRAGTGYVLGRRFWGQGYATEACRAMVELARGRGLTRLDAYCHADHLVSGRVLEKSGLAFEALLRAHVVFPNLSPALQDVRVYATNPSLSR